MKIKNTVVCLPVRSIEKTLLFYKNGLGFQEANINEGIILLELPNLSLFLMNKESFETYSKKAGREVQFPNNYASVIISCALESKSELDTILDAVPKYDGSVPNKPNIDEISGGYTGYFSDPDGHLWELVCPKKYLI